MTAEQKSDKSFSQQSPQERLESLAAAGIFSAEDLELLRRSSLAYWSSVLADGIENLASAYPVPLGIAPGFVVNGVERPVLMATEERSVVAAAAHGAKLARPDGFAAAVHQMNRAKGQILFTGLAEPATVRNTLIGYIDIISENIREMCDPFRKHGGGFTHYIQSDIIMDQDRGPLLVVSFTVDSAEAMGAMGVVKLGEAIAEYLKVYTKKRRAAVVPCNDAEGKEVTVEAAWVVADIGAEIAESILDLQTWASRDPARAATHNKGIMNGVSAVCLATGQDVRAVEAAVHTDCAKAIYEARPKSVADFKAVTDFTRVDTSRRSAYRPLTSYKKDGGNLLGKMKLRLPIGTVGGATGHPLAVMARRVMKAEKVADLAAVIGAVGLAQNFAALRMLADEGLAVAHERLKP